MTDELDEITFCDECPYSGEPNGCNRKGGVCRAYDCCFDLRDERDTLKAENAELRARLNKAIELPCKVGDTVYCISPPFNDNVDKGEIVCVRATKWMDKYDFCITVKGNQPLIYVEDDAIEPLRTYYREDINETWFTDRAEAEKKLAELKGEER